MSVRNFTRREALLSFGKLAMAAFPASLLLSCRKRDPRGKPDSRAAFAVAVVPCPDYDAERLYAALETGWRSTNPPEVRNKRVVIKPNIVEFAGDRPINTDARLADALIHLLIAKEAREIILAEGPAHNRDAEMLWKLSGYQELAQKYGIPLVDLNYDDIRPVAHRVFPGSLLRDLYLPRTVLSADVLISLPKMKTHRWAGITLSLKNMFGIVPGIKYGWPKNVLHWNGIPKSVCEVNAAVRVHYAIVDGVVGMEGYGPLMGTARKAGVIVMGDNPLAVDSTSARIMGVDPAKVEHFRLAHQLKLGTYESRDIRICGMAIPDARTDFELDSEFAYLRAPR